MKYLLNGDYFFGDFQLPYSSVSESPDEIILKVSPADLSCSLYEHHVYHKHIETVINSASKGFEIWKNLKIEKRVNYLIRYRENLVIRKSELANTISLETGRPLWDTHNEIQHSIINIEKIVSIVQDKLKSYHIYFENQNSKAITRYRPIGPHLIITPFCSPCFIPQEFILNVLLSGNSFILKPSEKVLYSSQIIIECFHKAQFPKGVINFIVGGVDTTKRLLQESEIKGVIFAGSKEAGLQVLESSKTDISRQISLHLGSKNTAIINEDFKLEPMLDKLIHSCYLSSGQLCTSTTILLIHENIIDQFIVSFHKASKNLVIDHPIDFSKQPFMGPLIDEKAMQNYLIFMGMAKREGAQEIMRGKHLEKKHRGFYVSPSIHLYTKFDAKSLFLQSEILGPNCTIIPFQNYEDAIKIVNSIDYGLLCSVYSEDLKLYEECLDQLNVGSIYFNRAPLNFSVEIPFLGIRNSGNYRTRGSTLIDACVFPQNIIN